MAGSTEQLTAIVEDFLRHIEGGSGGTPEEFLRKRGGTPDPETVEVLSLLAQTRAKPGNGGELGPYRLERELGRGAQGVVYLATDTRLGRKVALKVLAPHAGFGTELQGIVDAAGIAETIGAVRRFRREVEVAARLDHAGICPVYEAGVVGSSSFIAMRYVEGRTLADLIAEARGRDASASSGARSSVVSLPEPDPESSGEAPAAAGPGLRTEIDRVCLLVERAARALHVAHEQGLVHRDIKPGNLMVTPSGAPVILDFGLARDVESGNLTRTGTLLGTPVYMSPEQVAVKEVDRRTDVYSLGVVLFECLALRRPFDAPTLQALCHEILTREPPRLRKLNPAAPPELAVVVETALAKERERRYRAALDLAEDLRRVRERLPIRARPPGPLLRLRRWAERSPALAASLAVIFVLLVAGLDVTSHLLGKTSHALVSTGRERDAKDRALRHTRALALANASAAEIDADPMLSLLLAREAARTELLPETLSRVHDAINASKAVAVLQHGGSVRSVEFLPDGNLLMSAGGTMVRLWDREWNEVRSFRAGKEAIAAAALSPAGDRIVTAAEDGRVWDLAGNRLAVLHGHADGLLDAVFSPDGKRIVTASKDGTVRLWTTEGEPIRTLAHEGFVWGAAISPDGTRIAGLSNDGEVRLWNVDGDLVGAWPGKEGGRGLVFSDTGDRIAHLGRGPGIRDLEGQVITPFARGGVGARYCSNGTRVLVAEGWGLSATLYDAANGQELLVLRGHTSSVNDAVLSPDGRVIATASQDGTVRIWEPGRTEGTVFRGHTDELWDASFSPDGSRVATASCDGTARIWRIDGSEEVVLRHGAPVASAGFSPTGDCILTASYDGTARLWHLDGTEIRALRGHRANLHGARFSPDGRLIVTSADDGEARLWKANGDFIRTLRHPHAWVKYASFSPDGRTILTACRDSQARMWDLEGKLLLSVRHEDHMTCAAFSPDGDHFVTTSGMPEVRLWHIDGTPLAICRGPMLGAIRASFSPDGRTVATAHCDGAARLWALDGTELLVLGGHERAVTCAVFSADGRSLLTASIDGTARLWRVHPDDLLRVADERILRDFTREERLRFADILGPENRQVLDAHALVERLAAELFVAGDVLERIRTAATLDEAVRTHALRLAAELRDDPIGLSRQAWFIVRYPDGDVARALRWVGRAAEIAPEDGYVVAVLGFTLYRKGECARAAETLARARAMVGAPEFETCAFLALSCKALGRDDEARGHLEGARRLAAAGKSTEAQPRILKEAEARVAGR